MTESWQKKISRVRRPRVHMIYEVDTLGAVKKVELPFVVTIVSDLTGERFEGFPEYQLRKFIFIDPDNFAEVFKSFQPTVSGSFSVDEGNQAKDVKAEAKPTSDAKPAADAKPAEGKKESYVLKMESIDDFNPLNIIKKIPFLKERYDKKLALSDLKVRVANNNKLYAAAMKVMKEKAAPDVAVGDFPFANDWQKQYILGLFTVFTTLTEIVDDDPVSTMQKEVSKLDVIISNALNQILHNPGFKDLESRWVGLKYLIKSVSLGVSLKICVLNATKEEIDKDLEKAMEFDQSNLFKLVYEKEFGSYGGNPYGLMIFDYYIKKNNVDFMFLHRLCGVAASAHMPVLLGTDPSMFDLRLFDEEFYNIRDLAKIFDSVEAAKFKSFVEGPDSKYISLVLPRFLGRTPCDPNNNPVESLNYQEQISCHEDYLFCNSVYALGSKIMSSFEQFGWFSTIIGPQNGGEVENLSTHIYKSKDGEFVMACPTEVSITDRREYEISKLGFIPLIHCKNTDKAAFFSCQTANKPDVYDNPIATANAKLSSQLPHILNASRIAHYMKIIGRLNLGTFTTGELLRVFLMRWLSQYVILNDSVTREMKAQYPFRQADVEVFSDPSNPGAYKVIAKVLPHSQLTELTMYICVVSSIDKK